MSCHNDPPDLSAPVKYTVFAMGRRVVWHKFTHVSKERTAAISNEKSYVKMSVQFCQTGRRHQETVLFIVTLRIKSHAFSLFFSIAFRVHYYICCLFSFSERNVCRSTASLDLYVTEVTCVTQHKLCFCKLHVRRNPFLLQHLSFVCPLFIQGPCELFSFPSSLFLNDTLSLSTSTEQQAYPTQKLSRNTYIKERSPY